MAVSDWSSTADDNTEINGISIAEHCPAKNMNNALRAVMAALKAKCDALDSTDNSLRRGALSSVKFAGSLCPNLRRGGWYAMGLPWARLITPLYSPQLGRLLRRKTCRLLRPRSICQT